MSKIKPCPRCGGQPLTDIHTLVTWIRCKDCGFIVVGETEDEARSKWDAEGSPGGCECESCSIEG